jgi:hypothetical protein
MRPLTPHTNERVVEIHGSELLEGPTVALGCEGMFEQSVKNIAN